MTNSDRGAFVAVIIPGTVPVTRPRSFCRSARALFTPGHSPGLTHSDAHRSPETRTRDLSLFSVEMTTSVSPWPDKGEGGQVSKKASKCDVKRRLRAGGPVAVSVFIDMAT